MLKVNTNCPLGKRPAGFINSLFVCFMGFGEFLLLLLLHLEEEFFCHVVILVSLGLLYWNVADFSC